jgi:dCMP deaminase
MENSNMTGVIDETTGRITGNSRPSWDKTFGDILDVFAARSKCIKYKTAAMVVSGTQIMSFGYNGTFKGCEECSDYWKYYYESPPVSDITSFQEWTSSEEFRKLHREWSKDHEIHAEVNALNWISKRDIDDSYVLYTSYSPCDACAKEIISYGIKKVAYKIKYPSGDAALQRLKNYGIECQQI